MASGRETTRARPAATPDQPPASGAALSGHALDAIGRSGPRSLPRNGHHDTTLTPPPTPASTLSSAPSPAPSPAPAPHALRPRPAPDALRPDVRPGARSFNRDLSWLEFNARVLFQAFDDRLPLLERVRFLGIFTSNLDEFVMKRVGYLKRAVEAKVESTDDGLKPAEMLAAVRACFEHLEEQQARAYEQAVRPMLADEGIELLEYPQLSDGERHRVEAWYRKNVFPVLTPLAVDPGHRFPFISNLSQNLGVLLQDPREDAAGGGPVLFARVKVPQGMPQWVRVPSASDDTSGAAADPGRGRFVQLHQIIRHNLDDCFPGMRIVEVVPFRVTRAADAGGGSDGAGADNLLDFVELQLKRRRFANVVRLEIAREASPRVVGQIVEMFGIKPDDVDPSQGLLDFRSLFEIADLPRPDLKNPVWTPVVPARLRGATGGDFFAQIRKGDILVHHPYESFAASAERFIAEAAADPNVMAIKQTIYRTSRDSPFVQHLVKAAEQGKQVACLVELRARFDESRNVRFAQALEKAGVHVAYGVVGLKTHCKAALVVRREPDGLRSYAHIGTGNYNSATAQLYTDLGLFTCDPAITADVVDLFNLLTGRSRKDEYQRLLVAPATMKRTFIELIRREAKLAREHAAGRSRVGGRIIAKMNALEDPQVIDELYAASSAGVRVTLIVRGFCTLRPGVPGLSENIEVRSVVGRFLEHSRVFYFGAGQPDPLKGEWYIGSGDWMHRNLDTRVEAATPVLGAEARRKLLRLFEVMLADARHAWVLRPDGRYVLAEPATHASSPTLATPHTHPSPGAPTATGSDPREPETDPAFAGTFATLMRDAAGTS